MMLIAGDIYDGDSHPWQCQPIHLSLGDRKEISNQKEKKVKSTDHNETPHASSTVPLCKGVYVYAYQYD